MFCRKLDRGFGESGGVALRIFMRFTLVTAVLHTVQMGGLEFLAKKKSFLSDMYFNYHGNYR